MSLLRLNPDVIILPVTHITLYPAGQSDQSTIESLKRGNSRRRATKMSAIWLQPQLQLAS